MTARSNDLEAVKAMLRNAELSSPGYAPLPNGLCNDCMEDEAGCECVDTDKHAATVLEWADARGAEAVRLQNLGWLMSQGQQHLSYRIDNLVRAAKPPEPGIEVNVSMVFGLIVGFVIAALIFGGSFR